MNESVSAEVALLTQKYLAGEMIPEEIEQLYDLIQKDANVGSFIAANVLCDFHLKRKFQGVKDDWTQLKLIALNDSPVTETLSVSEGMILNPVPSLNFDLNELVEMERREKPIQRKKANSEEIPVQSRGEDPFRRRPLFPLIATTTLLFALLSTVYYNDFVRNKEANVSSEENVFVPTATITELIDAKWADDQPNFKRGQIIGSNRFHLLEGMVQYKFKNGTELIMNGPGNLVINGEKNVFCEQGTISLHVPPQAVGFEVGTPFTNVIDRGTDFFVSVTDKGTEVGVVKGLVDFVPPGERPVQMTSQTAMKIDAMNHFCSARFSDTPYVSSKKFTDHLSVYIEHQREVKKQKIYSLNSSRSLLALYDFNRATSSEAANLATSGRDAMGNLFLFNTSVQEGSLFGSKAVTIKNSSSRIVAFTPGQYSNMTFVLTVKVDRIRSEGNILLASEGYDNREGAILWQILPSGEIQVQIQSQSYVSFFTSPVLPPHFCGTWNRLALTIDRTQKKIRMYLDGKLFCEKKSSDFFVSPGRFYLGNLFRTDKNNEKRFLDGAIEDFYLFDRVLTSNEIKNFELTDGESK